MARENKGPCKRRRGGVLVLCNPLAMSISSGLVGIDVHQSINFKTGKLTSYVGCRADRKAPVMLFNACPFCRFEYVIKKPEPKPSMPVKP